MLKLRGTRVHPKGPFLAVPTMSNSSWEAENGQRQRPRNSPRIPEMARITLETHVEPAYAYLNASVSLS